MTTFKSFQNSCFRKERRDKAMQLDYLKYFLAIDEMHSISAAADSLYIGAGHLSSIVKSAKNEWGIDLFRRTQNGIQTTPEGESALNIARTIVAEMDEIAMIKERKNLDDMRTARIISLPSILPTLSVQLSKLFLNNISAGHFALEEKNVEDIGSEIMHAKAMIGLTYYSEENIERFRLGAEKYQISAIPLYQDKFYVLMRPGHALAEQEQVDLSALHNYHFALLSKHSMDAAFLPFIGAIPPDNTKSIFTNSLLVKKAIANQDMIGVLTGYTIFNDPGIAGQDFVARPIAAENGNKKLFLCLLHLSRKYLSTTEKIALVCIKEYFQSITNAE